MNRMFVSGVLALLIVLNLSKSRCPIATADDQAPEKNTEGSAYQRINKALDGPTEMDFIETPLNDVVEALKIRHGIEIQLDAKGIAEVGASSDIPITRGLKGISLRSALRLMLAQYDLDFVVRDEVLLITAAEHPTTWVSQYNVGDLLVGGGTIEDLVKAARLTLPRVQNRDIADKHGDAKPSTTAPPLTPVETHTAANPTGTDGKISSGDSPAVYLAPADGDVAGFRTVLIVRSTREGQKRIAELIAELRRQIIKSEQR